MSERLWRQAFDLLCDGDQVLGRGMSRTVYGSKLLPDSVIDQAMPAIPLIVR